MLISFFIVGSEGTSFRCLDLPFSVAGKFTKGFCECQSAGEAADFLVSFQRQPLESYPCGDINLAQWRGLNGQDAALFFGKNFRQDDCRVSVGRDKMTVMQPNETLYVEYAQGDVLPTWMNSNE